MDGLSVWVLSIVGVVVLGVLIDVIIPEGQTNKYIKSIFAIVTVFVIASPLPKLVKSDFNFDEMWNSSASGEVDEDYLNYLTDLKCEAIAGDCVKVIEELGVTGAKVTCRGENADGKIAVKQILVDLSETGIVWDEAHIDIIGEIVSKICKLLNIEKDKVVVYGGETDTEGG